MKSKILILFFLSAYVSVYCQSEWKLKTNSDGIKVYIRNIKNSNICEFKASILINAKINDIYAVIADAKNYSSWIDQVSSSKNISKTNSDFKVYYQIRLPIGIRNRDIVLDNRIAVKKPEEIKIILKSIPNSYPRQNRYVRIKKAFGYWLLTSKGSKTEVTYQFYSDPEASFPASIINLFIVDGPYKTLSNLRKKTEK